MGTAGAPMEGGLVEAPLAMSAQTARSIVQRVARHPLLALPNVLITPHLAGTAAPASARSFAFAIENMARLATGEDMLCVVDPADFDAPARSMEAATAPAVTAEPASGATLGTIDSRRRWKSLEFRGNSIQNK